MGALWLWQQVNVSWIEVSWAGGSRWLMWRSLTPAETDAQSLTTQEKPNLQPEDFFSPSACVDTVQSVLVLLWHSLSFPDDFPLQRAASCVWHIGMWRASSIQDWANVGYTPGTWDRWDAGLHRHIYRRSIAVSIDCVQSSIRVQCPQWKRTGQTLRGSSGLMRTTKDTDTAHVFVGYRGKGSDKGWKNKNWRKLVKIPKPSRCFREAHRAK